MRGIRDAQTQLADFSIEVLTETVEDGVPDELIAAMDRLVAAGAGGLAISGLNHPRLSAHIDALAERGISTVTFESDVPGSRRLCFFGENLNRVGRVAGGLLVPLLEPGDVVIAASGSAAIEEDRIRVGSFTQALTDRGFPERIFSRPRPTATTASPTAASQSFSRRSRASAVFTWSATA